MESVLGTDKEIPLEIFFEEYYNCRKNKRNKATQLAFEWDYYHKLTELYDEVNSGTYEIGTSICFLVYYPKLREVFAADFRDRIVHHVIMRRLGNIIESHFIDDSYNCRVGKGVYYGIHRLQEQLREATDNFKKDAYIVKCDLKGFFMSIDKALMWQKLKQLITEEYHGKDKDVILYLVEKVVNHCPEKNCEIHGDRNGWNKLSPDKSLFTCGEGKGMPIGNLTSQIFANYYMAEFDTMMKAKYGFYGRYVDDFYVICRDKEVAKQVQKFCETWLKDNLHLTLSRNKTYIQPAYNGVEFTGSVVKKNRIYVGSKTIYRFVKRVELINDNPFATADYASKFLNSYLGFLSQGRSYNIRRNIISMFRDDILIEFDFDENYLVATTPSIRQHREEKKSIKRKIKSRNNYYKRKYYEKRRKKSKALDCR